jgi:hypothetical protein
MNYLIPHCHREYTDDQATRMEASYNTWRLVNPNNVLDVVLPVATDDDGVKGLANKPVVIDVLANDVTVLDVEDLKVDRITAAPTSGTAVVATDGRSITYKPENGYTGTITFKYRVFDCNGVSTSEATVSVEVPPVVECASGVQRVQLAYGACDDGALPNSAVTLVADVTCTLEPPGPRYAPGFYTITVVPDNGTPSCTVEVNVVPCQAVCVDKTVETDPWICLASIIDPIVSIIDSKSVGKTALVAPRTTTQSPPAPYVLGVTSSVSVVVNYPNDLVSAASNPACSITVQDKEAPRVAAAVDACLYPKTAQKYPKARTASRPPSSLRLSTIAPTPACASKAAA